MQFEKIHNHWKGTAMFNPYKNSNSVEGFGVIGIIIALLFIVFVGGCGFPAIKLPANATDPLREYVLEGEGHKKVALISVNGVISDLPSKDFLMRNTPSMMDEVIAQLNIAKQDPDVKAVVLKINSPGGTATASDILYKEIMDFKRQTGVPVVASMMDLATSGGYYVSLAADLIVAHPTTITGSVGVIALTPDVSGLMDKLGIKMSVHKSGRNKDMGSMFRPGTEEENRLFDEIIKDLAGRFTTLVASRRSGRSPDMEEISTARIYTAPEALKAGLIDKIGYLDYALACAKSMAGLSQDAAVVAYRRTRYPDDTIYNPLTTSYDGGRPSLVNMGILDAMPSLKPGFYYLWWPSATGTN